MPDKDTPGAPETTASGANAAKAAFEDYRKRMWAASAPQAYPHPHHPGFSAGPYAPPPPPGPAVAGKPSLFEALGTLLRSSVEFLNTGLQGGTQLLQGLSGTDCHGGEHPAAEGCHGGHPVADCSHGCGMGHSREHRCLYGNHCCDPCRPGVYNCCG